MSLPAPPAIHTPPTPAPAAPGAVHAAPAASPAAPPQVFPRPLIPAVAATGTIQFAGGISPGDTVTIGSTVYAYVATAPLGAYQFTGDTAANLRTSLRDAVLGENGPSTPAHPTVTAAVGGFPAILTLTAKTAGEAGNSIALAKSGANITISGASLTGGADAYLL
jgi:phage tail sheath gpL-like